MSKGVNTIYQNGQLQELVLDRAGTSLWKAVTIDSKGMLASDMKMWPRYGTVD